MFTVINLSTPVSELPNMLGNWGEMPEEIKGQLLACDYFMFSGTQVINVYKDDKMEFSCMYTELHDIKFLENAYNRQKVDIFVGRYEFDFFGWADKLDKERFVYKVVGDKTETFDSVEDLLGAYKKIGLITSKSVRQELQGQPRLEGLLGAMYGGMCDGKVVIRYEVPNAKNMFPVEEK
ncbi:hypothetical protein FT641_20290 [Bacillus paranthracis]|uniref:hypothetical protein n=1 Tax=Bacillus paranthracis TaxID=2026186 RepID=UPI00187A2491|nr:hypothetical protein [Bacillus paranthracis]MBE7114597.1 hypothetical protein [Bacillus paranthracis]MBE7155036.1 hypothetical protein [Bacillus paranthracis]